MSKEQKSLKSCHILDRLREWFELYGNQNHQRAEEELHLAIDELYDYQQKDQKISDLEAKLAESEKSEETYKSMFEIGVENNHSLLKEIEQLKQQLAEKEKQYQDAVANRVNIANIRAILKLHKVQDRIDDMKSKYDCDIDYHLGANNELTHLWEYIDELIEEMSDGKDV